MEDRNESEYELRGAKHAINIRMAVLHQIVNEGPQA